MDGRFRAGGDPKKNEPVGLHIPAALNVLICCEACARGRTLLPPSRLGPTDPRGSRITTARVGSSVGTLDVMSSRSERQAARELIAAYHEARLADLVQRVGEAIDRFRAGETDAFEADQVIFQYSRSAKEVWKFCNAPDVEFTAQLIQEREQVDWWAQGAPRSK
jgi:hypothetical protein